MTDYCAGCGHPLKLSPNGGRYRCCDDRYWSAALPAAQDRYNFEKLNGEPMRVQTACVNPAGEIVRHEPLYLYGPVL